MTCKHSPATPGCTTWPLEVQAARKVLAQDAAMRVKTGEAPAPPATPDAERFEVVQAEQIGSHLVLEVLYPSCEKCAYEGRKVLVYFDVSATDALRWRRIDPHFRASERFEGDAAAKREAPSPAARFPASEDGWNDATAYVRTRSPYVRAAPGPKRTTVETTPDALLQESQRRREAAGAKPPPPPPPRNRVPEPGDLTEEGLRGQLCPVCGGPDHHFDCR